MTTFLGPVLVSAALAGDLRRCEQAMARDTIGAWADYAERFPQGRCVELAYRRMEELRLDAKACHTARVDNTLEAWSSYARRYPTGSCGVEAASELLARRQRGEVPSIMANVAPIPPEVRVHASPDHGEPWTAQLGALAGQLSTCELPGNLELVMTVHSTGPGAAEVRGEGGSDDGMCVMAVLRDHPWPRPADDVVLTVTVWP